MKRFRLTLICIVFASIASYGQYKSIFAVDTTQWNYFTDFSGADHYGTAIYKAYNDTSINGSNFKKLNEDYLMNNSIIGFIKEDTINGRVWLRPINDTIDYLIMDLNLQINDTFLLKNTQWDTWDEKFVVEDIIIEDDQTTIKLTGTENFTEIEFIEGIGTNFIFHYIEQPWVFSELLCAYKDNELKYHNSEFSECYIPFYVSINKDDIDGLKVYPIPASDVLTIHFTDSPEPINSIKLLNLTGMLLLERHTTSNEIKLDISDFEKGVYVLILNRENVHKIIINGR